MIRYTLFCVGIFLGMGSATAQEIQNTLSYRTIESDHYFRFNYENDLFFHTDYYYTQGVHFELVHPALAKSFLHWLFPVFKSQANRYGIGLESAGYTPTTIFADSILKGDRPFAGMAYLQAFAISNNPHNRSRLSSVISLGLMGPAAGGYEIQSFIHRYTGNPDPIGWKYQVKNQVILNYELNYEKAINSWNPHIQSSWTAMLRLGNLDTKAAAGAVFMAGIFDDPFKGNQKPRHLFAYGYLHPQLELIGFDASLEGGPFTSGNPYTIDQADLKRLLFRNQMGVILGKDRLSIDISSRYLSPEFNSGKSHLTGGIALGISF